MSRRIVMVGGDIAPSKAFSLLAQELCNKGIEVDLFVGNGKAVEARHEEIEDRIANADALLVGLSSFAPQSDAEIKAIRAAEDQGVPWGFYEDTYGVYERQQFRKVLPRAWFSFAIDSDEKSMIDSIYPRVEIVVVGNPTWDEYFFPKKSRQEVREQIGIGDDELMVLVSGVKAKELDLPMMILLVNSNLQDLTGRPVCLVYSPHPGMPTPFQAEEYFTQLPKGLRVKAIEKNLMTGTDLLPGSDLVVSSVSSLIIGAACRLIPTVGYVNRFEKDRQTNLNGQPIWPVLQMGFCPLYDDEFSPVSFGEFMKPMIGADGQFVYTEDDLAEAKERFPQPAQPGQPAKKMADYLDNLTRERSK